MFKYRLKRIVLTTTDPFIKQKLKNQADDDNISIKFDDTGLLLTLSEMDFYEVVDYLICLPGVPITIWQVVEKQYELSFMVDENIAIDITNCDFIETDLKGYINITKTQNKPTRQSFYEVIASDIEDVKDLFLPVVSLNKNLEKQFLEFLGSEYMKRIDVNKSFL